MRISKVARSPLKIILFGEHSVVAGGRCLAVAICKYGYLEAFESPESKITVLDSKNNKADLEGLVHFTPGMNINIVLETPLGCGLGTSGAISLLLSYTRQSRITEDTLDQAHAIEDVFHGRSSGVDVSTCYTGGLVSFKRKQIEKLPTCYIEQFKIMFFDSRIPKNTAMAIKIGGAKEELYSKIEEVAEEAYELLKRRFTLHELYKLIRKNQNLLDELGVCPDAMRKEIYRLRGMGIEAKVTGGGCGGCLVTLVEKTRELPGWTSVPIDRQGFCAFD